MLRLPATPSPAAQPDVMSELAVARSDPEAVAGRPPWPASRRPGRAAGWAPTDNRRALKHGE